MTHRAQPRADGHPGASDRADVALGVCALIALAREAGVSCDALLWTIADTWDEVGQALDTEAARHAADRITG